MEKSPQVLVVLGPEWFGWEERWDVVVVVEFDETGGERVRSEHAI